MTDKQNAIRLSMLNPELRKKVEKFDTLNDGALTIEEALQAIIALQKQSNNYKRTVYLLIPLMLLTLVGVLGINILSIYLTKDMKVNSSGVLTNNNGNIVQTKVLEEQTTLFSLLTTSDLETLYTMTSIQIDDMLIPVQGIYVKGANNETTTVLISTPYVWFQVDNNGAFYVELNIVDYVANEFAQNVYHVISTNLQTFQTKLVLASTDQAFNIKTTRDNIKIMIKPETRKHETRGIGGFSCGRVIRCL
jgi:hypothetical protein